MICCLLVCLFKGCCLQASAYSNSLMLSLLSCIQMWKGWLLFPGVSSEKGFRSCYLKCCTHHLKWACWFCHWAIVCHLGHESVDLVTFPSPGLVETAQDWIAQRLQSNSYSPKEHNAKVYILFVNEKWKPCLTMYIKYLTKTMLNQ